MSTFGSTSVGTNYGMTPAVIQTRGVWLGTVPSVGGVSGDLPAPSQTTVAAATPGIATAQDEISQEAALVDGAISMPARPLAEIIWQLRAAVNEGRGSIRASRSQPIARDAAQGGSHDDARAKTPSPGEIKVAARAYSDAQTIGSRRTPVRSVDIYHGTKK